MLNNMAYFILVDLSRKVYNKHCLFHIHVIHRNEFEYELT